MTTFTTTLFESTSSLSYTSVNSDYNPNSGNDSNEKITRSTNITIGIIVALVCFSTMVILYVCYIHRRSKDRMKFARTNAEEAGATRRNPVPVTRTVHASNPSNFERLGARGFYGDQIFRHELGDGSEIEKGERSVTGDGNSDSIEGGKEDSSESLGGGTGSPDSGDGDVAELNGISNWDVRLAEFNQRLENVISNTPQRHEFS